MKKFNKLVRDNVPSVIRDQGRKAVVKIATDGEFYERIKLKLVEEAEEFKSHMEEEDLADILEVIHKICELNEIEFESLEKLRIKKRNRLGGFDKKVILWEADHPARDKEKF